MSGKKIALILLVLVTLIGIPATLYLVKTQQDNRSRASEDTSIPVDTSQIVSTDTTNPTDVSSEDTGGTSCQTPVQVQNVQIDFPIVDTAAGTVDNTQAKCSWSQVSGAANYTVKITELDSNTVKSTQTVPSTQLNFIFPVDPAGKTYQCDVSAVNSCGTSGPVGSQSFVCKTDAVVPTTPITIPPTIPVTVPPVTQPPLPPTGPSMPLVIIGAIGGMVLLIGGALLVR